VTRDIDDADRRCTLCCDMTCRNFKFVCLCGHLTCWMLFENGNNLKTNKRMQPIHPSVNCPRCLYELNYITVECKGQKNFRVVLVCCGLGENKFAVIDGFERHCGTLVDWRRLHSQFLCEKFNTFNASPTCCESQWCGSLVVGYVEFGFCIIKSSMRP
jgi:hypothetical protein